MNHVIAVLGFAALCMHVYAVQRWTGTEPVASCGRAEPDCSACGAGHADCPLAEREAQAE